MSAGEPIRCAHCHKSQSHRGFLKVKSTVVVGGVRLFRGDMLRAECALAAGFVVPEEPAPIVFRIDGVTATRIR